MTIICCIAALILGFLLGWVVCNNKHLAQRGQIAAKTIHVCKALIVGTMESPEFHAAVMSQVHPGADPSSGFNFVAQQAPPLPEHSGPVGMSVRAARRRQRA